MESAIEQLNSPKVSVIIPVYNCAEYVRPCLDSVLKQSLPDIEVICVDDGSTDDSLQVLNEYQLADSRVIVRSQVHAGQSAARNLALQLACGKYVQFVDADDLLAPKALEEAVSVMEADDLDLLLFNAETFFDPEELATEFEKYQNAYQRSQVYSQVVSGRELFTQLQANRDFRPLVWLQLASLRLLREFQITFYEGIVHEDNLFTFLTCFQASRAKSISSSLYHRRVRQGSIMTSAPSQRNVEGYFACMWEIMLFFNGMQLNNAENIAVWQYFYTLRSHTVSYYKQLSKDQRKLVFCDADAGIRNAFRLIIRLRSVNDNNTTQHKPVRGLRLLRKMRRWVLDHS